MHPFSYRPLSLTLALLGNTVPHIAQAEKDTLEIIEVHGESTDRAGLALDGNNSAASRLGISLQDLPASASLINKESIAVKGDYSGLSAVTRSTGFASSASPGNGGTSMSVRGFNGHSSIVNTYDGTRLYIGAGTVSFPADTWTLERIEVLRGPGSVVNGIGAIGATVNYVPKKPRFTEPSHEILLAAGSDNLQRLAIGSGGQLTDQLAYRIDAVNHSSDGYVDRAEEERSAAAGSLLFTPVDDLKLTLSVDYADTEAPPYWGTPLVNGRIESSIRKNNYNIDDGLIEYEDLWPRLLAEWKISQNLQLRSESYYLTSERHWRNVESYDYNTTTGLVDRSSYLEILHEQEQLGNRTDLSLDLTIGEMDNRLNFGWEVNQIDFSHINNSPYTGSTSVDLSNPEPGRWADGVESETTRDYDTETQQYAFFIDNLLKINDQWHLVTGVRHDQIDYERSDLARSNGQEAGDIDTDLSGTSWRIGSVYKPTHQLSFYAQYSKAVDSIQSLLSATDPTLNLAEGKQVEFGVKHQLLDDRLQYTLAVYDISKSDLMSTYPNGIQRQIGKQTSRGIETEIFFRASDALDIQFNWAFTDAEYKDFVSGSDNYSGNTPRNIPDQTANLWINWQLSSALTVSTGARYVAERYLDDANTLELPDYIAYDANVQWQVSEAMRLSLIGKNLTDNEDYVMAPYGNQWILADGRTVEIAVNYSF